MRQDLDNLIRKPKLVKRKKPLQIDHKQLKNLVTKYAGLTLLKKSQENTKLISEAKPVFKAHCNITTRINKQDFTN